jgi:peptidoglycan hydrolase-like protein with peptidoglycan-binding domain
MLRLFQLTVCLALLAVGVMAARAFSLLGPLDPAFQTPALGYNPFNNPFNTDIGGPQNLGEEYRWNIKTITYGFDESFLNYFGTLGTAAVHQAFKILNDLPSVSEMSPDLSEFPTDTKRVNFQASALGLLDIKSHTLAYLVEELGLTSPERYAWCLRDRDIINLGNNVTITNYTVIQRNFEPAINNLTPQPTPYVNGVLYTYTIQEFQNPAFADAVESTVDPLAIGFTAVASVAGGLFNGGLAPGEFFIGLTRDDVGGLRYLLRTNNYNIENLDPAIITTPTVVTNPPPPGSPAGTPPTITTNIPVVQGLRPGVEKITFQEGKYDSLLGVFITFTNTFTDRYVTNSTIATQIVQRVVVQPDILIGAADLGTSPGGAPILIRRTVGAFINNDAINGSTPLNGPGVIQPQITILFSKIGPYFFNSNPFFVDETTATPGVVWGSFDGSTNPPIVFPNSLSVQELESQVLSGP